MKPAEMTVLHFVLISALAQAAPSPPPVTPPASAPTQPAPHPPADERTNLSRNVRFRLADGVRMSGTLTSWDRNGFDGSFGRREWTALHHEDIRSVYTKVMDRRSATQWVDLGRALLLAALDQPDASPEAEKAFRFALQRDGEIGPAIEEARRDAAAEAELRRRIDRAAAERQLRSRSPEEGDWQALEWGPMTSEDRDAAVVLLKDEAASMLQRAGLVLTPVETKFFLFYTDLSDAEAKRWSSELDKMYVRLAEWFGVGKEENLFWGKAVIFVFRDRDRFRLVEAESFRHFVAPWADGVMHPLGPRVFVSFYRQPEIETFAAVLVHEATHGFMHRFISPRRLPTWANEGLADYVASVLFRGSPIDQARRQTALRFIRSGADVNTILSMRYEDDSWPGEEEVGYGVGYLLVELMIREEPARFAQWVRAIKRGKDWEQALVEDFGAGRVQLVDAFTRWYRVND